MTPNTIRYHQLKNDPAFKLKRKLYSAAWYQRRKEHSKARSRAWALKNPEKVLEIAYRSRVNRLALSIYRNIRKRAAKAGIEFTIDYDDIHIPETCPIFGVPFNFAGARGNTDYSPSIDRIDSSRGYVPGNIQVISKLANCMKWTATPEQLEAFCRGMLAFLEAKRAA